MEILEIPYESYRQDSIDGWIIKDSFDDGLSYILLLEKNSKSKVFYIRKNVIKSNSILSKTDVYELRYKDYEDSALLTLDEVLSKSKVMDEIKKLIDKYSKYDI